MGDSIGSVGQRKYEKSLLFYQCCWDLKPLENIKSFIKKCMYVFTQAKRLIRIFHAQIMTSKRIFG